MGDYLRELGKRMRPDVSDLAAMVPSHALKVVGRSPPTRKGMPAMDDALKARFRQFAQSWNDEDHVCDDSRLTGADLKAIADAIDSVVAVRRLDMSRGPEQFDE